MNKSIVLKVLCAAVVLATLASAPESVLAQRRGYGEGGFTVAVAGAADTTAAITAVGTLVGRRLPRRRILRLAWRQLRRARRLLGLSWLWLRRLGIRT